jgi:hypothetical protein
LTIHDTISIPEATFVRHRERATPTDAPDPVDVATMLDAGSGTAPYITVRFLATT